MNTTSLRYNFLTEFMKIVVQHFYDTKQPIGFHSDNIEESTQELSVNEDNVGKDDLIGLFINRKMNDLENATIQVLRADNTTTVIPYSEYLKNDFWPAATFFVSEKMTKSKFQKIVKDFIFNGLL